MIKGDVVVVTGGAGFFGAEIIKTLKKQDATPISLDIHKTDLCESYPVDLTKEDGVIAAVETIIKKHGKIDGLINNAGVIYNEPLINIFNPDQMRHNADNFRKYLDINLTSVFMVTSVVVEKMVQKRIKGKIISMSSISAQGNAGQTVYSAAKAGIEGMTKTWAKELGSLGIKVNAIAPGFIDTASTHKALSVDTIKHIKKNTPLRSLGHVEDLVKTVVFLLNNDFVNGEIIKVDGGLTL